MLFYDKTVANNTRLVSIIKHLNFYFRIWKFSQLLEYYLEFVFE